MKKLLALCLALLSLVSAAASAEVLADGWQDAGLEALQQAQQDIANRISELRAASAPAQFASIIAPISSAAKIFITQAPSLSIC